MHQQALVIVKIAQPTGFYTNNMSILKRTQKYVLRYIRKFPQVTGKAVIDVQYSATDSTFSKFRVSTNTDTPLTCF